MSSFKFRFVFFFSVISVPIFCHLKNPIQQKRLYSNGRVIWPLVILCVLLYQRVRIILCSV